MELTLQPEEQALLRRILSSLLSDLKMEISNTEDYELRLSLKRDEETIKDLIVRLGGNPEVAAPPGKGRRAA